MSTSQVEKDRPDCQSPKYVHRGDTSQVSQTDGSGVRVHWGEGFNETSKKPPKRRLALRVLAEHLVVLLHCVHAIAATPGSCQSHVARQAPHYPFSISFDDAQLREMQKTGKFCRHLIGDGSTLAPSNVIRFPQSGRTSTRITASNLLTGDLPDMAHSFERK